MNPIEERAQSLRLSLDAIARIREEMGWPPPEPVDQPVWYQVVTKGRNA